MTTADIRQPRSLAVIRVCHASPVAAVQTAEGPISLLAGGLVERLRSRGRDVRVFEIPEPSADVVGEIGRSFSIASAVADAVAHCVDHGRLPIVLSGSCHSALGSVSGLPGRRSVVWLDAHGDFNTPETSPSGLLDGTTLATITGRAWGNLRSTVTGFEPVPDESIVMVGVRELDAPGEASLLEAAGISHLPAAGIEARFPRALHRLRERAEAVYLHLDLDVLDPSVGTANAYAAPDGLSLRQLRLVVESVRREFRIRALGVTSYDPATDLGGGAGAAALDAIAWFAGP